jgi:hypothetical protein
MPPNFQAARAIPFQRAIFHFIIFWNYGFWGGVESSRRICSFVVRTKRNKMTRASNIVDNSNYLVCRDKNQLWQTCE